NQTPDGAVALDANSVLRAVKRAIADDDIVDAFLSRTADGHAVAGAKRAVGNHDVSRRVATASHLDVVVADADRAVLDQHAGRADIHRIGVGRVAGGVPGDAVN